MYVLLIKQFIRSRTVVLTTAVVLFMGVIGMLSGKQFIAQQERAIAEATRHQQEHITRYVDWVSEEVGLLLYYLRFAFINTPDPLAALSIGQRDVNPGIQSITIRTLEAQRYDTDLNNPLNLQAGNLDVGFVIIYLFPLLVIAFTYDLLSEEKEKGTWRLVAIQSTASRRYLWQKLLVRAMLLYLVLLVLFAIAVPVLSLPLGEALAAFIVLSLLYLTFWLALCFWVVSLQRHSSFNALALLSIWVLLAILLPASVNNLVANRYPVPEALGTLVAQRDGYHEKWDMEKKVTMDKFYAHYPQYAKYGTPQEAFNWLWYYAMQQMGDDEAQQQSSAMREKIMQRERASRFLAWFIPSMYTQLMFNDLARSSLGNHLAFLDQIREFHERLRLYFYPKIFENVAVEAVDWGQFEPVYFSEQRDVHWPEAIVPLLVMTAVFSVFSLINVRRLSALE